jgi:Rps23 Pro-64 3,4-dihydroxylase Tpa1-like proline 4-hydroxylase
MAIPGRGQEQKVINLTKLETHVERYHQQFSSARPFKWLVIDDFLSPEVSRSLNAGFDIVMARANKNPFAAKKHRHVLRKIGIPRPEAMEACHRELFDELQSPAFLRLIERITGIVPLYNDPSLVGGGLHETYPGGYLNVHTDFNFHPVTKLQRRLNIIIYLNEQWRDEWAGHLELWPADNSVVAARVAPLAGRMALFETSETSFHGHPEPLACPEGVTRRSIAAYYYADWPEGLEPRERTNYRLTPAQRSSVGRAIQGKQASGKSKRETIDELTEIYQLADLKALLPEFWT